MESWNFYQPDLIAIYYEFENTIEAHHMYTRFEVYNMIYVFDGKITVTTKDEDFTLSANDVFMLTPQKKAEIKINAKTNLLIFHIDPILFKNTQDENNILRCFDIHNKKNNANNFSTPLVKQLFESIKTCICGSKGRYHVVSRFVSLICEMALEFDRAKGVNRLPNVNITLTTIDYIEKNFTEDLTLESVANEMGISKNSVGRICRAMRGRSFLELLNDLRFEKARHYLLNENVSIKNIATLCGFKSYNTFYKSYLKKFGEVPSLKSKKIQEKPYWPFESANYAFEETVKKTKI